MVSFVMNIGGNRKERWFWKWGCGDYRKEYKLELISKIKR
jgi:hypothetical protein